MVWPERVESCFETVTVLGIPGNVGLAKANGVGVKSRKVDKCCFFFDPCEKLAVDIL